MANTPKKKTVSFGGLDLPSPSLDSPGKKRRVENKADDDEMDIERELSGLSSSRSVPSLSTQPSSSAEASDSGSGSPFTFAIPFSPTTSTSHAYPQPQQAPPSPSPSPSSSRLSVPAPAAPAPIKPSQSLSSGLSRYVRHPSLVAPSPLRQSTKFADSPESVKSNGGSPAPAGSPLGAKSRSAPPAIVGAKATKAGSMMLDFIQEEEVAKVGRLARSLPGYVD